MTLSWWPRHEIVSITLHYITILPPTWPENSINVHTMTRQLYHCKYHDQTGSNSTTACTKKRQFYHHTYHDQTTLPPYVKRPDNSAIIVTKTRKLDHRMHHLFAYSRQNICKDKKSPDLPCCCKKSSSNCRRRRANFLFSIWASSCWLNNCDLLDWN